MKNQQYQHQERFSHVLNPTEWIDNHQRYLYNFARSRVNDQELVRDLVQETFLAALESITSFQFHSSERTWLTAILKNKIYKSYCDKSRNIILLCENYNPRQKTSSDMEEQVVKLINHVSPDAMWYNKEFSFTVKQCIRQLPALTQSVFFKKYILEESKEAICLSLQISESYFWVICHRIKVHFKKYFKHNWY